MSSSDSNASNGAAYTDGGEARPTKVLLTGAAGFIGYHVACRLLARGTEVVGVDNLNDYYDPALKTARLDRLQNFDQFRFVRADVADDAAIRELFEREKPRHIVHLAAQAGVRYSLTNPHAYTESNVRGFLNILEGARAVEALHLVYASSSSVYGANTKQPFSEHDNVDHPLSLYAATKKANELMAHTYSHLFRVPSTGLRFFTVYGPWGRPDMALFRFARGILAGEPIPVYNYGRMIRDFTYIDDIAEGVVRTLDRPATADPAWNAGAPDPARSNAPYRLFNIGNNRPVPLLEYIAALEKALGRKAQLDLLPMQPGDVPATQADVSELEEAVGFRPTTTIEQGIQKFVDWYRDYYGRQGE
jgi:UDP-glucuronate 4-epimerase